MAPSTRQNLLAEVWNAEGIEALLSLLARSPVIRDHGIIHELHEQSVECERTAPEVSAQLHRVAGQLTELHAGLRLAEGIDDLDALLLWQTEVPWRQSDALHELLAAAASGTEGPESWPWQLGPLASWQAQLDRVLSSTMALVDAALPERHRGFEAQPLLQSPAFLLWLAARSGRDDPRAPRYATLREQLQAWQRVRAGAEEAPPRPRLGPQVLAEVMALWHRLDPILDRTCEALRAEVVTGRRSLADALRTVVADAESPERDVHRRAYLLYHLLDEPAVPIRRAALAAYSRLVMSPDAQAFDRLERGTLVQRWAVAIELHWRVLPEPATALDAALRVVDQTLPSVIEGTNPRLARDLLFARARLLRRLAGWRDGMIPEATRAYGLALDTPSAEPDPVGRARALGELASLRRARREPNEVVHDQQIRALYDEALELLGDALIVRARVLADYAVYLARPLRPGVEDADHARLLIDQAVGLLEELPESSRDHPLVRGDEAEHRITRGNLRLEVGTEPIDARRQETIADYEAALFRLGEGEDLLAGLVHLDLACVALAMVPPDQAESPVLRVRRALDRAVQGLEGMPVLHARAVAERAMLAVKAARNDESVRERCIREVESALHGLPLSADRVVRGRVEEQLGELYLFRDGLDDLARAGERFAAARSAFVEGGAARLAVEAARGYAEAQLRQHADDGDPGGLIRGAVVLEQAALLAERRWASRRPEEPTEELVATLDGVFGDLAWFQARLARPASALLHTVTRAKRHRVTPSLRSLLDRVERSSMLSPGYFDPMARRLPAPPPSGDRRGGRVLSSAELDSRVESFVGDNPDALLIDFMLTRWGTVVVVAGSEGTRYCTVPLARETVRRWVWGRGGDPGWWGRYLAYREALDAGDDARAVELEKAWRASGQELARGIGLRVLVPAMTALECSLVDRVVVLSAGPMSGLPLAAAQVDGRPLARLAVGLAQVASLADLPEGRLSDAPSSHALCVLADSRESASVAATVGELDDVVRLLTSARTQVEVLAGLGDQEGEAIYRPSAKARERTTIGPLPTVAAVQQRIGHIDHLFYGGHGRGGGLMLLDEARRPALLEPAALRAGPRWPLGSSVFISAATRVPPPSDDADLWDQLHALCDVGVGFVIVAGCAAPPDLAREFVRGFYLYWALGRSIPRACCAALANVAGSDPSRLGAFMVWLGSGRPGAQ